MAPIVKSNLFNMRISCFLCALLLCYSSQAQVSLSKLSLPYGKHTVGFKHYLRNDSTRTYQRMSDWDNKVTPRPIPVSLWFPAQRPSSPTQMTVESYMAILKEEEEWEALPNERILDWFYYTNTQDNKDHFKEVVKALANVKGLQGKFPVVVYAPSYQASSVENFALCELLASRGFVVIASPSRGTENRFLQGASIRDIETQARDIRFLIAESAKLPFVDPARLAVMGFSFGGISNVLAQMMDPRIKAIICLDGSIKYQYNKIQSSPYYNIAKLNVPFIFMSQKDIPLEVMKADNIDTTLNTKFEFYDSLLYSDAYYLKFNNMTHPYFSSMGVLFQDRDKRQDKADTLIMDSYKWMTMYTLNFLQAFLTNNEQAKAFLANQPVTNGVVNDGITKQSKKGLTKPFSFEEFNLLARQQNYNDLPNLYYDLIRKRPGFKMEEWKANSLGLSLLFNKKMKEGISVLKLNTILFPESANAHDSLGEGYLMAGDKENAAKSFRNSLKYDPHNQNAINRLKQL
jgi:dienelactone hydrolase